MYIFDNKFQMDEPTQELSPRLVSSHVDIDPMYTLKFLTALAAWIVSLLLWIGRPFGERTMLRYANDDYWWLPVLHVTFDVAIAAALLFFGIGVCAGIIDGERALRRKKNT